MVSYMGNICDKNICYTSGSILSNYSPPLEYSYKIGTYSVKNCKTT